MLSPAYKCLEKKKVKYLPYVFENKEMPQTTFKYNVRGQL